MMGRTARRRAFRFALLAVLIVVTMSVAAACGTGAVSISVDPGSVSVCYRGLPTARNALHEPSAKLHGVHRVPYDDLHKRFPNIVMPVGDDDTEVCTFSFTGTFRPGQVEGAPATEAGIAAVIVVSSKKLVLVTSWVGNTLPKNFGGRPVAALAQPVKSSAGQ
jgi:hypothetical protein